MKLNSFYIAVLSLSAICVNLNARPLKTDAPALSERQLNHIKDMCKEMVKNYYADLNTLTGENISKNANQDDIVEAIQQDCFRSAQVMIENSIPAITQDKLSINNYLKSITVLSDKIGIISYNDNITLSDVYYDNNEHFYYIVASAEQKTNVKSDGKKKKIVDFYLNFDPGNNLELKIYSIQNHTERALDQRNIVQILHDENVERSLDSSKPYFLFDVNPNNASIAIDGKTVFNDGRKIAATPGNHTVEILAANYQSLKFDVNVSDTGIQHIARILILKHGYLAVNTPDNSLQDAEIYIDTNMVGNLPLTNYQLSVGAHYIEIKRSNGFYKSYHVTITDENTTTLNIQSGTGPKWEDKKDNINATTPTDVSFQFFYDQLAQYGQWVEDPQYGNVWVPANVNSDFRPYYTDGHWVLTDYGNTWVSDEPWGWACYHYGRWTYSSYYGWLWVPGYEWAPAWVAWRFGNEACGWAPLSPDLSVGVSNSCPDSWWVFVGPDYLYNSSGYLNYQKGPSDNSTYIRQTSLVNNIYMDNSTHARYNYGPRPSAVENVTHKHVQVYHVLQTTTPGRVGGNNSTIGVYKANLKSSSPLSAHPSYIIHADKPIDKPQEIASTKNGSDFRRDIQNNKVQPQPYYRSPKSNNGFRQPTGYRLQPPNSGMPQPQGNRLQPYANGIQRQQPPNRLQQGANGMEQQQQGRAVQPYSNRVQQQPVNRQQPNRNGMPPQQAGYRPQPSNSNAAQPQQAVYRPQRTIPSSQPQQSANRVQQSVPQAQPTQKRSSFSMPKQASKPAQVQRRKP